VGDFPPAGVCVCVDHEHEKERKRKGKTYFGFEEQRRVSSPVARMSRSDF